MIHGLRLPSHADNSAIRASARRRCTGFAGAAALLCAASVLAAPVQSAEMPHKKRHAAAAQPRPTAADFHAAAGTLTPPDTRSAPSSLGGFYVGVTGGAGLR
jgi:hypothetical protein